MKILPFLYYSICDESPENKKAVLKLDFQPNLKEFEHLRDSEGSLCLKEDMQFRLSIKNIGLNTALNLSILETIFLNCPTIYNYTSGMAKLEVNEEIYIDFSVILNMARRRKENKFCSSVPIELKLAYNNLKGDYYEQIIKITCGCGTIQIVNDEGNEKTIFDHYYARINQNDISKPQYYEDKSIAVEERKRFEELSKKQ